MARMTIELPDDMVELVIQIARKESVPKMEVLRRMFTVLRIAQEEKEKGNDLGIVNGEQVVFRFAGI